MAKHDTDPVLHQLVRAINESEQVEVPIMVSVHGTLVTGALIPQRRYFSQLVQGNPLMGALEPSSGLLGKEYAKDTEAESGHHLHILAIRTGDSGEVGEGLWRISLEAVDGWVLRAGANGTESDKGPFARLLGGV
jgi:hypothetical protein